MNSPEYKARRREEVEQEMKIIESKIRHQTRLVESYQEAVDRMKAKQLSNTLESKERAALEMKQKDAQKYLNQYKKPLNRLRKNHNVLRDLERSLS